MNDINNEMMDQVTPCNPAEITRRPDPLSPVSSPATIIYQKGTNKKRAVVNLKKLNRVKNTKSTHDMPFVPETQRKDSDFIEDLSSIRSIQQAIENAEEKSKR